MLGVAGLVLLVALVGVVVLGLLCLGLWRRLVALVEELGVLSDRIDAATAGGPGLSVGDLERDLAAFRALHPDVDVQVHHQEWGGGGRSSPPVHPQTGPTGPYLT